MMNTRQIIEYAKRTLPLWSGKRAKRALDTVRDPQKSKIDKLIAIRAAAVHRRPPMEALIRWCDEAIQRQKDRACPHGNAPEDCGACYVESDLAYDAARESGRS